MVLSVARPHRDKKTGIYYLRERVPSDLLTKARGTFISLPVGDTLARVRLGEGVKVSLRTKLEGEARRLFAVTNAALQEHWQALRQGPRTLTHKETVALAGEVYGAFTSAIEDNPGGPEVWAKVLRDNYTAQQGHTGLAALTIGVDEQVARAMEERFGPLTDTALMAKGLHVDDESRGKVLVQVSRALDEAAMRLKANAEGDYSPDTKAALFPAWSSANTATKTGITFEILFDKWLRKKERRADATVTRWRPIVCTRLPAYLGHSNPRLVTKAQIIGWRDALLQEGIKPSTVLKVHLAAVRSVYRVWVEDDLLPLNPAAGVVVGISKARRERERGFTDDEALSILKAAKRPIGGKRLKTNLAAIRWAPWLCAFTGARIGEMTQLRKEDVFKQGDIWVLKITPEAGDVKGDQFRNVPLHKQLIEEGFLEFVAKSPSGPLFYTPDPKRSPDATKTPWSKVAQVIAEWVRKDVGITDTRVPPNHGWRHRFVTIAREVGMDSEKREFIIGHALPGMSQEYGDMRGLHREIEKLPKVLL